MLILSCSVMLQAYIRVCIDPTHNAFCVLFATMSGKTANERPGRVPATAALDNGTHPTLRRSEAGTTAGRGKRKYARPKWWKLWTFLGLIGVDALHLLVLVLPISS